MTIFLGVYAAVMQHFCLMTAFLAVMVAVVVLEILASVTFFALNNDPSMHANTNAMLKKTLQRCVEETVKIVSFLCWVLIQGMAVRGTHRLVKRPGT